jgi:hypothetical protein
MSLRSVELVAGVAAGKERRFFGGSEAAWGVGSSPGHLEGGYPHRTKPGF